jgi:hypothetical protein
MIKMKIRWLYLLFICLLTACAVETEPIAVMRETAVPTPTVSEALRQDAASMAEDLGIAVDEAIRRFQLQEAVGPLGAQLEANEADTFAGLWLQQEPEFRVVVAFTRDGQATMQPYLEGNPIAEVVEIRTAEATLAELKSAQTAASSLLAELDIPAASGINVQANQVELYITDEALFAAALQGANEQLPEHVVTIVTYEPLGDELPFPVTPEPTVYFPQLKARSASFMGALLVGELVVTDGCLRLQSEDDQSHLVIWQTDYFLNNNQGTLEILDREGQVVARVGEPIQLGGGEIPSAVDDDQLQAPMPASCTGPYWLMGEVVPQTNAP